MRDAAALARMTDSENNLIAAVVRSETPRLRAFVRRQVADLGDVEDILQETFSELVAAYRLMKPVEHVAGWLLRVARNRVVDRFRSRSRQAAILGAAPAQDAETEAERVLDEWLIPVSDGPDAAYTRAVLADELDAALDELPPAQRAVFVAHEIEGRSFRQLAQETGLSINTLLGRKHAAILHLRRRLQAIYEEFGV
jgi:RNA polymerase sigma factor (sigma-70 family)